MAKKKAKPIKKVIPILKLEEKLLEKVIFNGYLTYFDNKLNKKIN